MDSNSYYYSTENKTWIPEYLLNIHNQYCKDFKLCEKYHSFIKGKKN